MLPILLFGQSKHVWLHNGDIHFAKADYATALTYYKKAKSDSIGMSINVIPYAIESSNQKIKKNKTLKKDSLKAIPKIAYINHQIATCYMYTFDYKKAVDHFKPIANNKYYPNDKYYYALSLMNTGAYDISMDNFEDYLKSDTKSDSLVPIAKEHIRGCYFAMSDDGIKKEILIKLADSSIFNVGSSSFAPMVWGDNRVIFTSAREGGVVFDRSKQNSAYLCDLYWSEKDENGSWGEATNFGRPLNSSSHDASGCFNNNNVLFYTKWNDKDKEKKNIHLARMSDFKFYDSYKLDSNVNYPGYMSINPFVTLDGKELYFSSNRPGGYGGMDIWKVKIDVNGNTIEEAINVGSSINSISDEVAPFFHEQSSNLFFSSNGHASIGGLDIYKSHFDQHNDVYAVPTNLGTPINSNKDDSYIVWDKLLKHGYFSSDREPCENGHCYNIYEIENSPIKINLKGFVYDKETNKPISNASVTFKDIRGSFEEFNILTDTNGFYKLELEQNAEIFMKAQKQTYFADAAHIDTRKITESASLTQDFYLAKIPKGEIEIPGIEYDFDAATLRPKSKETLDIIVEFLELNDNITIEIFSHTDSRGNDDYNLKLSEKRARSVVEYLVAHGIDKTRLSSEGKGETEPLDDCSQYEDCGETGKDDCDCHQKNRRTAFKTIREDFKEKLRK